jgi:hypothetical protein
MAQPPTLAPDHRDAACHPQAVPTAPSDLDQARRTSMAAQRTWLASWRTALAASVGALAVGRLAPELLDVASWPYVLLGCGYAAPAVGAAAEVRRRCAKLPSAIDARPELGPGLTTQHAILAAVDRHSLSLAHSTRAQPLEFLPTRHRQPDRRHLTRHERKRKSSLPLDSDSSAGFASYGGGSVKGAGW